MPENAGVNRDSADSASLNVTTTLLGKDKPVLFLGLADHWQPGVQPFPIGGVDFFKLSRHKIHVVYPGIVAGNAWVFLIDANFFNSGEAEGLTIRIVHDETGTELGNIVFNEVKAMDSPEKEGDKPVDVSPDPAPGNPTSEQSSTYVVLDGTPFVLFANAINALAVHPGLHRITASYGEVTQEVGRVQFHYRAAPPMTPDQIKAMKSDPNSAKAVRMDFGCKFCDSKYKIYTAIDRATKEEAVWYTEIPDQFVCKCGKTRLPLRYVRESMHGLLLKNLDGTGLGISYVRQYGHTQVVTVARQFIQLLDSSPGEAKVQSFIEKNPMLLARFHAKRLFVKPNIIGRFQADFAILDSQGELWFIEIEKPNLRLFRQNGHPTADLMHAYGQVNDWLRQYNKYGGAILEALKLKLEDVVSVRGAVIAGRSSSLTHEVLQRHYMAPPYPSVHFMTFDDLASSLFVLSKKLA